MMCSSWQSRMTYCGVELWTENCVISVDMNAAGCARVPVGISMLSKAFLFIVENNGTNIISVSFLENSNSGGCGKTAAWLAAS